MEYYSLMVIFESSALHRKVGRQKHLNYSKDRSFHISRLSPSPIPQCRLDSSGFFLRGQFKKHDLIAFKEGPTNDTTKRGRHATKSESMHGEK